MRRPVWWHSHHIFRTSINSSQCVFWQRQKVLHWEHPGPVLQQAASSFLLTERVIVFYFCVDVFSAKLLEFHYSFAINHYVDTDHDETRQWLRITNMLQDVSLQMWLCLKQPRCLHWLNFVLSSDWRVICVTFWSVGKTVTNCPTESSKSRTKVRNGWQTRSVILQSLHSFPSKWWLWRKQSLND